MQVRSVNPASQGHSGTPDAKLAEACQDFEAMFLKQLLGEMRRAGGGAMGGGLRGQVYQDICDHELARQLSEPPGIGIGRLLLAQLKAARGPADR